MAEKKDKALDEAVDVISDRVKESVTQDLMEWRQKVYDEMKGDAKGVYDEMKGDVKEHLSALRDSDNALNLRVIKIGDSVESLAARVEKLTSEEGAPPRKEETKVEVEAKTELAPPEEEELKDILVVCDHGGKGPKTGFTTEDKTQGVTYCPQCGRRITYT